MSVATRRTCWAVALVLVLTGCGGGGNSTTPTTLPPTTTLPPCTQTVLFSFSDSITPSTLVYLPITTAQTGRLDILIDWTFADSHIGVYVTPSNTCRDLAQFNPRSCNFLIRSEDGPKPRKVSAHSLPAGNYDLLVANFATQKEATSAQGFLRSESCPTFATEHSGVELQKLGQVTGVVAGK